MFALGLILLFYAALVTAKEKGLFEFSQSFGIHNQINHLIPTEDGGYCGCGTAYIGGIFTSMVVRFDSFGRRVWFRSFRGNDPNGGLVRCVGIGSIVNNGILVQMNLQNKVEGPAFFIIQLNENGFGKRQMVLNSTLGGFTIQKQIHKSGDLVGFGRISLLEEDNERMFLYRGNPFVSYEWAKMIDNPGEESQINGMTEYDGRFLACGYVNMTSGLTEKIAFLLASITFDGQLLWRMVFGIPGSEIAFQFSELIPTEDEKSFYAVGYGDDVTYGQRGLIIKFNKTFGIEWARGYKDLGFLDGVIKPNGNILATGGMIDQVVHAKPIFVELTPSGTFVQSKSWTGMKELGFNHFNAIRKLQKTTDDVDSHDGRYFFSGGVDTSGFFSVFKFSNETGKSFYVLDEIMQDTVLEEDFVFAPNITLLAKLKDESLYTLPVFTHEENYPTNDLGVISPSFSVGKSRNLLNSVCYDHYYGPRCDVTTCDSVFSNSSTEEVCDGVGTCDSYDECEIVDLLGGVSYYSTTDHVIFFYQAIGQSDGGLLACGKRTRVSGVPTYKHNYIQKMNSKGSVSWYLAFTIGIGNAESPNENIQEVLETRDSGILAIGESYSRFYLVKFRSGSPDWVRVIEYDSTNKKTEGRSMAVGEDGAIYTCLRWTNPAGKEQIGFIKFSPEGNTMYSSRYNVPWNEELKRTVMYRDSYGVENGTIYVGESQGGGDYSSPSPLIGRLDSEGVPIWSFILQKNSFEGRFHDVVVSMDGEVIGACGDTKGGGGHSSLYAMFNASTGKPIWAKRTTVYSLRNCWAVTEAEDGGFVFGGNFDSFDGSGDPGNIHFIKFTRAGDIVWSRRGKTETDDFISSIEKDHYDGRYVVSGSYNGAPYFAKYTPDFLSCELTEVDDFREPVDITDYVSTLTPRGFMLYMGQQIPTETNITSSPIESVKSNLTCWSCVGLQNNINSNVSNNSVAAPCNKPRGVCENDFKCNCHTDYLGDECQVPGFCFNISRNASDVCSGNGQCIDLDVCGCYYDHFGEECELTYCYSLFYPLDVPKRLNSTDNSTVCSGYGSCNTTNGTCSCFDYSKHFGLGCDRFYCYGIINNETDRVCSGTGKCVNVDKCQCDDGYRGNECDVWDCFGFFHNDTEDACTGHGNCSSPDDCDCVSSNYTGSQCETWYCDDVARQSVDKVCSGHGVCMSHDNCTCIEGYFGPFCGQWECFNKDRKADDVCGGHGYCLDVDECFCKTGYGAYVADGECVVWFCGKFENKNDSVGICSGRGDCVASHVCECRDGYKDEECKMWSCGFDYDNSLTCSGNGECIAPDDCVCNSGFVGDHCETNMLLFTVMTPVLTVAALALVCALICGCCLIFVFVVLLVIGFCLFLVCLVICFFFCVVNLVLVFVCGLFCLTGIVVKQKTGLKKFKKLKNFDLLMREQEMEDDTTVAHLRMNKELFQIPFEEIQIDRILGEGGSNSIVFRAKWHGKGVAFKCFKTRQVCSSQETYTEFEREVEILGSVSHPHIVRFFGATMKPPRVGIVMEFCEHGDVDVFLDTFRKKYGVGLPFREKMRIMVEQISACEYLHSRNIIHRDLKWENVLIDSQLSSKLMDFGLSKLVDRMSMQKTKKIGTTVFISPELVLGDGSYNEKCDVFSFAIMMWILVTEIRDPYGKKLVPNVELKVANDENFRPDLEVFESKLPKEGEWMTEIVSKCWKANAEDRYSFSELHKIFKGHRSEEDVEEEVEESGDRKVLFKKDRLSMLVESQESQVKKTEDVKVVSDEDEGVERKMNIRLKKKMKEICELKELDFDEIMKELENEQSEEDDEEESDDSSS